MSSFIDDRLSRFTYAFGEYEKLRFVTFLADVNSNKAEETSAIKLLHGGAVSLQVNGFELAATTREHIMEIRKGYQQNSSLAQGFGSMRWKVYRSSNAGRECTETLIGFVGLSLKTKQLEPHVRIKPEFHSKGYGTKIFICLLTELFRYPEWLNENVAGLKITIQPENKACISMMNKVLLDSVVEDRNHEHCNGIWLVEYEWWMDKQRRTQEMRKFVCKDLERLSDLLHSDLFLEARKLDLEDTTPTPGAPPKKHRTCEFRGIDDALQDFSYEFDSTSACAKLYFQTFKKKASEGELEEVLSVYGDPDVMRQSTGVDHTISSLREAENIRRYNVERRVSLEGLHKSLEWKLYYVPDYCAVPSKRVFVGVCGISIRELGQIKTFIYLKPEYQRMGIGQKCMLCLMHIFLTNKALFDGQIQTVAANIHSQNISSLRVKDKLLSEHLPKYRKSELQMKAHVKSYTWYGDQKKKTVKLNKFVCSVDLLESVWVSIMQKSVSMADRLYFNGTIQNMPTLPPEEICPDKSMCVPLSRETSHDAVGDWVDGTLQSFSYEFDCGSKRAKLSFRTLGSDEEDIELKEISSVFGDKDVMLQCDGIGVVAGKTREGARMIRRNFMRANGFGGSEQSIRWKLYYTEDTNMKHKSEVFVGFVGMSMDKSHQLYIHSTLRLQFTNKSIGSKVMLCFLHLFLVRQHWFRDRVNTIVILVVPSNDTCMGMKRKLLGDHDTKIENIESEDGLWPTLHAYCEEPTTVYHQKFECPVAVLEGIWVSKMIQEVNKLDRIYFHNFSFQQSPLLENDHESVIDFVENLFSDLGTEADVLSEREELVVRKLSIDETFERKLQNFAYEFAASEKLLFRTFSAVGTRSEVDNIRGLMDVTVHEIEIVRKFIEHLRGNTSFSAEQSAFTWQVHVGESTFVGIVTLQNFERHLSPLIFLAKRYQNKGIGTQICICLLISLLGEGNRAWFERNFDGIRASMPAGNTAVLSLIKKCFGLRRLDEYIHTLNGKITFEYSGKAQIESLCYKMLKRVTTKKRQKSKHLAMGLTVFGPTTDTRLKIKDEVYLDVDEVKSKLLWVVKCFGELKLNEVESHIARKFQLNLPTVQTSVNTFYILFFTDFEIVQEFELAYPRNPVNKPFLAFMSNCTGGENLLMRLKPSGSETSIGYLLALDKGIFDANHYWEMASAVKSVWITNNFVYHAREKKSHLKVFETELVFHQLSRIGPV